MTNGRMRSLAGVVLVAGLTFGATGCSGDGEPGAAVSKAASAVSSAAAEAPKALESAAAAAKSELGAVKDGVNAKDEVTLGAPATDGDGYATVPVTVRNTDGAQKSFAVQVNMKDAGGNLLDVVVVTIADVPGNGTGQGTARSTHKLSGAVTAETGTALRY
ncbi:hypothetical protein ACWGVR_15990 [Streptomyces xanthophaeus]